MMTQKAVIVELERSYNQNVGKSLTELNTLLAEGWKVVHSCPMPSSMNSAFGVQCCLVVVEKEKEDDGIPVVK